MNYLLRKYSYNKWKANNGLTPMQFSADSVTNCIKTRKNQLSVWLSESNDFTNPEVEKLVVALATTMDKPDVMDFVWLETDWFEKEGIPLVFNEGQSKYLSVNDKHRDLSELNLVGLSKVGEHIVSQMQTAKNCKRFSRSEILKLVLKWQKIDREFSIDDLKKDWQEPLAKLERQ